MDKKIEAVTCSACAGSGVCQECNGEENQEFDGVTPFCEACDGSGECRTCDGTGEEN